MHQNIEAIKLSGTRGNPTFSPAIRAGDYIFLSGMTAVDDNRKIVGEGDIAAQARFIYSKISKVLEAAGTDMGSIVETVDYVTTFDNYEKTADVRREVFGDGPYPAATGVKVAELVRPAALIEIRAVAYIGKPR
ncbi:RidA family protein [Candidimonas nitroreducens]|uniref:RidA family protein n=1 Tax=Candidimonas nitroreducens TaxID=683354 RepID=A0A225LYH0_9BURK|nr:RidA family protein [Candidimonas nitroreducens]OWT54205.1 RidA family protein [Candidimonas nitroreducens]